MKAIRVRYLGPTNTKGSRFKASADGWGSVTIPYDHGHSFPEWLAALALLERQNRTHVSGEPTIWGRTDKGETVFCFPDSEIPWPQHPAPGQSTCARCHYPMTTDPAWRLCPSCR